MTLNGVIVLILFCVISPNSISLQADYVKVVNVCRISSSTFGQNRPTLQRGLSAIAELLVTPVIVAVTSLHGQLCESVLFFLYCVNICIAKDEELCYVSVLLVTILVVKSFTYLKSYEIDASHPFWYKFKN